ncbi:Beta-propeller repeat protein [Cylindrospermum stagnale PCC 7417]|uniref:Beta-propeller repeat protein n=1 Tax=Cylindrospermum stagnale PCC 7417 TaxID=56107 RepID=K9WVB6_9NOST|nr:SBBP repeat-containing protein [Cylindrospermum stagnale]AFZ24138.1 Beta-propeller repeat protein [Cylindrospermum stagnale PCC 7417]
MKKNKKTTKALHSVDEKITESLRSTLSDVLPDQLQTYIRTVLQFSGSPEGANLLTGPNTEIEFFSQDTNKNFPNIFTKYSNVLTVSSEPNFITSEDQEVKIIWGRHGSDSLIGFDPGADLVGKRRIDTFVGDFIDEKLSLPSGALNTGKSWSDRFILGDWRKPFYVEDDQTLGLNQSALILDFNPTEDVIQLHGNRQDYELVNISLGTAIFWREKKGYDLIGVVGGVSDLSLKGDYFEFKGNTAPKTVLEKAEHIGTAANDYIFSSTVDAKGNFFVGGGTGGSLGGSNIGARDAWVAKYDSNGNQQWSRQFGSTGTESAWGMASDGRNIYVAGNIIGQLENNTVKGGNDAYLAKYDSDGNQVWIKQYGTYTLEESYKITVDTSGNIYTAGHTFGNLGGPNQNLGQGEVFELPSTDSYVAKFDSNGNQLWVAQFGTITLDDNWGVATDNNGNVFAGGNTKGSFGGKNAGPAGEYDAWLVKLNKDGQTDWVRQFGTPNYDFMWDIETDSLGDIYATGWTLGDLGGKNAGSYDVWLAKYNTNGNQLWIKQFGTSEDDAPFLDGIDIDSNDNIFLTGYTNGNLGGANAGSFDAWAAKFDKNGNQLWLKQFGTPDYDTATTVTADNYGRLYVSGITEGSLGATNAGSYDSWALKLDADTGKTQDFTSSWLTGSALVAGSLHTTGII